MHIAVDGSFWGGQERGVAIATRRLWSSFLQRTHPSRTTVFAPASLKPLMPSASLVPVGPLRGASKLAWQHLILPRLLHEQGVDLLYCPCYTAPLAVSCRLIITVHDLIAWTHPQLAGWKNALHLRLLIGHGARRAEAVCVPTEYVRRSVVDRFNILPNKVFVVPWGVDADITPLPGHSAAQQVFQQFGVDEPFILFCGCVEAKKNLQSVIRASAEAGILLLIVGPWISSSSTILFDASRATGSRWRYLGYVSAADLGALYSAATALIFPSETEGFGLPPIEAMHCGCPVIASNAPALLEVCGGAAIHVPHWDTPTLAASLHAVATNLDLRESLVTRGLARAAHFSWATAVDCFAEAVHYAQR